MTARPAAAVPRHRVGPKAAATKSRQSGSESSDSEPDSELERARRNRNWNCRNRLPAAVLDLQPRHGDGHAGVVHPVTGARCARRAGLGRHARVCRVPGFRGTGSLGPRHPGGPGPQLLVSLAVDPPPRSLAS
jgi:hypothetical protein